MSTRATIWCNDWIHLYHEVTDPKCRIWIALGRDAYPRCHFPIPATGSRARMERAVRPGLDPKGKGR